MNVEIGAEAALFPEKEYINGIAVAVYILGRSGWSCGLTRLVACVMDTSRDFATLL